MAETELPESQPTTVTNTTGPPLHRNASFSIWPPTERTRDAVRNRLIETFSSSSSLSKRYGTIPIADVMDAAKLIDEEAFKAARAAATTKDDGIEILQVYTKEISKRMLDTVKARTGDTAFNSKLEQPKEEDAGSTAPPQSEKTESVDDE